MMMTTKLQRRRVPGYAAIALTGLLLAACGRPDNAPDRTAGQRIDATVAAADRRADELRADAGRAATEMRQDAAALADRAGAAVTDATITATVNAALAADGKLSALKIDVDTEKGVVTLSGPAPDESARARATELAGNAKGVVRVENQLKVQK